MWLLQPDWTITYPQDLEVVLVEYSLEDIPGQEDIPGLEDIPVTTDIEEDLTFQ